MPTMTDQLKLEFVREINRIIFSSTPENITQATINEKFTPWIMFFGPRTFKNSATGIQSLRGVDVGLDVGELDSSGVVKPKRLRFIEQNPDKINGFGQLKPTSMLARQGHKIMWIINQDINNGFIGKMVDNVYEPIQSRPYYQRTNPPNPRQATDQMGNQYSLDNGKWVNQLPYTRENNIPDLVVNSLTEETPWETDFEFQIEE
jgi:hypothetical protein